MAIKVNWKGRLEWLPGTYTETKSGYPILSPADSAGDIMYIDTGSPLSTEYLSTATFGAPTMYVGNTSAVGYTQVPADSNALFLLAGGVNTSYVPTRKMIWSGGKGIVGQFENNDNCVYMIDSYRGAQAFLKGGTTLDIAERFFFPLPEGRGTTNMWYARACKTLAPICKYYISNTEYFQIFSKAEGTAKCSRFESSNTVKGPFAGWDALRIGYGLRLVSDSPTTFHIEIWEGGYTGGDNLFIPDTTTYVTGATATTSGNVSAPYGGTYPVTGLEYSQPTLVFKSNPFTNLASMVSTCQSDSTFNEKFYFPNPKLHKDPTGVPYYPFVQTGTVLSTAVCTTVTAGYAVTAPYHPFMCGINGSPAVSGSYALSAEDYSDPTVFDRLLEVIIDVPNTFFFCDRWGITDPLTAANTHFSGGALASTNLKILNHINTQSAYEKIMFVGGGTYDTEFSSSYGSTYIAGEYNTDRVAVVHSGCVLKPQPAVYSTHPDYMTKESVYTTAVVAGRLAGIAPQEPGTHKNVDISSLTHSLKKSEGELASDKGVLYVRHRYNMGNIINHSINTLQVNATPLNTDGKSYEISVSRIAGQLHKELINSCNKRFVGTNIGNSTPSTVKTFVEQYLKSRVATEKSDGLIISFDDVIVHFQDDYYTIEYSFVPNYPVNKVFIRSFILPYTPITI